MVIINLAREKGALKSGDPSSLRLTIVAEIKAAMTIMTSSIIDMTPWWNTSVEPPQVARTSLGSMVGSRGMVRSCIISCKGER